MTNAEIIQSIPFIAKLPSLYDSVNLAMEAARSDEREKNIAVVSKIIEVANVLIPPYAYGDNEAACEMANALQHILYLADILLPTPPKQ